MFREYDNIRLRISPIIHDFLNKKSQESGVSKQQIIRVMIEKCLSDEYGENIILNARKIKQQIKNEYENPKISTSVDPLQD
jgi:hypothetical protein